MKAVELERRDGRVTLRAAAMASTPAGALTEGVLTDGIAVADGLKTMLNAEGMRTRNAAAGVGGDQILCQSDVARGGDLGAFVRQKAAGSVGYALDAACLGWQPVESMIEGSVLWTAAPVEQVDWMRATTALAGRAPRLIAPQACAIANIYGHGYEPSSRNAVLVLHVGARRMLVIALRGWAVAYSRDIALSRKSALSETEMPRRVIEGMEPYLESLTGSVKPYDIELVLLSGGAARSEALAKALRARAGVDVETLDPFRKVDYPPSGDLQKIVAQHGPAMAVAAGLALTGLREA